MLCTKVDHLLAPSLLRDAGKKPDRLPAPAACTRLVLWHVQLEKYGAQSLQGEGSCELAGEGDHAPIGVPGLVEQVARRVLDADAHRHSPGRCTCDGCSPTGENVGREIDRTPK